MPSPSHALRAMGDFLAGVPPQVQAESRKFVAKLRRRQLQSSEAVARKTLEIMRLIVATAVVSDVQALITMIKQVAAVLVAAQPHELAVGNMVRRVLSVVRDETGLASGAVVRVEAAGDASGGGGGGPSLMKMLDAPEPDYSSQPAKNLKQPILEVINELIEELGSVSSHIAEQAIEHIHSNEVILTHGRDPTVEAFLRAAHKKRSFEVIVADTAPSSEGKQTAVALAEAGISVTLIADAAVFAMMARVNKVIVGAHAVMANGGLIATAGCHLLALSAQHASVPLVVCAGLYKLTPLFPSGAEQFNLMLSPQPMLQYEEGLQGVHVPNPAFDYVPPELVSLLITNSGPSHASYIYRLLAEYYHQEDHDLTVADER